MQQHKCMLRYSKHWQPWSQQNFLYKLPGDYRMHFGDFMNKSCGVVVYLVMQREHRVNECLESMKALYHSSVESFFLSQP